MYHLDYIADQYASDTLKAFSDDSKSDNYPGDFKDDYLRRFLFLANRTSRAQTKRWSTPIDINEIPVGAVLYIMSRSLVDVLVIDWTANVNYTVDNKYREGRFRIYKDFEWCAYKGKPVLIDPFAKVPYMNAIFIGRSEIHGVNT